MHFAHAGTAIEERHAVHHNNLQSFHEEVVTSVDGTMLGRVCRKMQIRKIDAQRLFVVINQSEYHFEKLSNL